MRPALLSEHCAHTLTAMMKVAANGLNSDLHATAAYRAHLVSVMAARAVAAAS